MVQWVLFPAIMLAALTVGCSTATKNIEGRTFLISQKEDDGKRDFGQIAPQSERGFLVTEKEVPVCSGNNKIRGGFFVRLQPVKRGQTETERKEYVAAEAHRVQVCTKLSLSCSTLANQRCRADDEACLEENKNFRTSTCRHYRTEEDIKRFPGTSRIADSSGAAGVANDVLLCADRDAAYTSPFYFATHTDRAWKRDRQQWEAVCRKFKTTDQCDEIMRAEGPTAQYATEHDMTYSKWAVEILAGDAVKVQESENGTMLWGEVQIDVSPVCGLLEGRH